MLSVRLIDYEEVSNTLTLLEDIDNRINSIAKNLYNNIIFSLNKPVSFTIMSDLLHYKRILTYRIFNEDYASNFTLSTIAGRIKLLKFKQ